jgi:uncharacterized protein (DUF983 family)
MTERSAVDLVLSPACPYGGRGCRLAGYLRLVKSCHACGPDHDFADAGERPAVFVMMLVGFVIASAALIVELKFLPPLWLHLALWLPVATALALAALTPLKALMIVLQCPHRAAEACRENAA